MTIIKKHFIPDLPPAGDAPPQKPKKIKAIPFGDSDFLTTAMQSTIHGS